MASARSFALLAFAAAVSLLPTLGCTSLLGDFAASEGALGSSPETDGGSGGTQGGEAAAAVPDSHDGGATEPERDGGDGGRPADGAVPVPQGPIRLATGEMNVHALAVDGTSVYFTRFAANGDVKQLALAGGAPIALGSGIDGPTDLALDGAGGVYWVTVGAAGTWQLFDAMIGVAGSARSLLSPAPTGAAHGIAVDVAHVFVGQGSSAGYATLSAIPRGGGVGTTVASGPGKLGNVRERGTDVVWTDTASGRVYSVAKTAPASLVAMGTGMTQPSELVLAGNSAFWINHGAQGAGAIYAGAIGAAQSARPIASNLGLPAGIATDGVLVFWTDAATGELFSMRPDGTARSRVAANIAQPGPLAATLTTLVWYDASDGSIWMIHRG